jgi:hypothetical protein
MKLTAALIREAVDVLDDAIPFRAYSGRGMYGKDCAAIEIDDPASLMHVGMALALLVAREVEAKNISEDDPSDVIDDAIADFRAPRLDSLGHGYVAYWPGIPFEAAEVVGEVSGQ